MKLDFLNISVALTKGGKPVMFHDIPQRIVERMQYLEDLDLKDRADGTPRLQRLRQIPAETGKFIALLAASSPAGEVIEIGTSAGYSALWLSRAGRRITTFEVLEKKAESARETLKSAGVEDIVELIEGDARDYIERFENIAFCFLDAEKEIYAECYEAVIPRLVTGGILVADNAINHRETLQAMLDKALNDERVDALIVPIGKGELVCKKIG
jgi:predicted O-methyltransferase YrrM